MEKGPRVFHVKRDWSSPMGKVVIIKGDYEQKWSCKYFKKIISKN